MSETDTPEEKEPPSDEKPSEEAADAVSPPKAEESADDAKDEAKDDAKDAAPPVSAKEPASEKEPDSTPPSSGDGKEKEDKLIARGNPLQWLRGGATMLAGGFLAFLLMAHDGQLRWGVPLGFVCVLVSAFGLMDFVGTFDDKVGHVAQRTDVARLGRPIGTLVAAGVFFVGTLMGAQSGGYLSQHVWGAVVTLAFIGLLVAIYDLGRTLGPWATDETGVARPLWRRHGFWLMAIAGLLYLPVLGSYSLWDPWETHYGEVAREILARDDWISLWWAQDGWFWSKPILNFWIQSLAMATAGTHYQPDMMLIGAGGAAIAHPEWVVRTPNFLLTILGMYLLYKGVANVFGRRAGLLGGIVLANMPDWFFLAHQTMTDMPFVAPMTGAMGLLLLGLHTDAEKRARLFQVDVGKWKPRFSGWHLVFGAILLCALPQIIYLISRNIELVNHGDGPHGFRFHWDEFKSGSGMGNCTLPGNEACAAANPASIPKAAGIHPETFKGGMLRYFGGFEPSLQGIVWSIGLGLILYMNWGERRVRRLYYLAAWFLSALATMGKGPAGFALPMICGFAYTATTKRWSELLRFEMVSGLLIILVVGIPWYVAMYVRHGSPFTDRLIFHDMFNRAFSHVHDTNEGDDTSFRFYAWQLGYAFFPWTGLAPLGLIYWLRRADNADKGRGDVSVFLVMWFVFAFGLFSFMGTKFHHYIFPAVPPVAMLVGIVLDDMMKKAKHFLKKDVVGKPTAYRGGEVAIDVTDDEAARRFSHERLMLGGAALAGALVVALVGRDLVGKPEGADQPGAIRLLQLFTYNYRRPWPEDLDFSKTLLFFTVGAIILSVLLAVAPIRRWVVYAFTAFALVWAVWGLDVYMAKTAQHWGQHEVIQAYYANRDNADQPLVAYQMNWKGENFYTGNKVPAFVSSGATFTTWVKSQKDKGVKSIFFVTEHSRTGGLRGEAGAKTYTELTDKKTCNKFVLVRADL